MNLNPKFGVQVYNFVRKYTSKISENKASGTLFFFKIKNI